MNDLTNLFHRAQIPLPQLSTGSNLLSRSSLSAYQPSSLPYSSASRSTSWDISELQNLVRKSVKKQVSEDSVREQMIIFEQQQRETLSKKILLILTITVLLALLLKLEGNTLFSLAMLVATSLLPTQALSFSSEPLITKSLQWITPLLYSSVIYCLLKWSVDAGDYQVNCTFTYLSILASIANAVMRFYRPLFLLSSASNIAHAVGEASIVKKLSYFPKFIGQKALFVKLLFKHLLFVVLVTGVVLAALLARPSWFNWQSIRPLNLLKVLLFMAVLQIYLEMVHFINETTVSALKIIKDKNPLFLNLLKLSNKPAHHQIHRQCLRSLYIHVHSIPFYLSTETWKSLTYKTYMDIFNQYAEIELERTHNSLATSLFTLRNYQRAAASTKSVLEDLFVYFRKMWARLSAEVQAVSIFSLLADNSFLFSIVVHVEHEGAQGKESIRISQKTVDLIKNASEKLMEGAQLSIGSDLICSELLVNALRLQSQVFWLKNERK